TDTETHLAVADVRVAARAGSPSEDFTVAAGSTDATGYYAFAVNAGTYELSVEGSNSDHPFVWYNGTPGGTQDFAAATRVTISADITVDAAIAKGVRATGLVDIAGGPGPFPPAPNVFVGFERTDGTGGGGATTAADGTYNALVLPGHYRMRFAPNDATSRLVAQYWLGKATRASADIADLTVPPPGTFNADLASGFFISGTITETGTTTRIAN